MPRIVAVANQKGGVGKTAMVLNLGAALAERGKRVLLFDLDPQAALTASVGFDPYHMELSSCNLLLDEGLPFRRIVRPLGQGLWLAPAAIELSAAEFHLARGDHRALRLKRAIEADKPKVDFILIDTPPSLGLLTVNALAAAEELLIPVECQYLALRGVRAVLETTRLVHERLGARVRLLGLVATMYRDGSAYSQQVVDELRKVFGSRVLDAVIEFDEAVGLAAAKRVPVLDFQPETPAAVSYRALADEVIHAGQVQQAG
jgi:chromosome partitioning protein